MSENTSKYDIVLQQEGPNDQDKKTHHGKMSFANKWVQSQKHNPLL